MTRTLSGLCVLFVLLLPAASIATPAERSSTTADRQGLNVTIYNAGTALVHDRRRVRLDNGVNRIAWRDVSGSMDPTTAVLRDLTSGNNLDVVEQNYDFNLFSPQALLQRYIGRDVIVVHEARFPGERETRERARVLSTDGGVVLKYKNRIETDVRGYIIFPTTANNFRDKPTLELELDSGSDGPQTLDLSYLTTGMSWHADYVGVLSADEQHMALRGIVTLSNTSGASYDNARLQLVAGNVNVVQEGVPQGTVLRTIATVRSRASGEIGEENYFEYHLYTLSRPTTILDKQTKQVTMFNADTVPVQKTLELRGSPDYYQSANADLGDRLPVGVYVTFKNHGGQLGIPLPAGIVRLYENDSRGLTQFLGSDSIKHTPKNEDVRLHLGDSFDVTARKRQTDFRFTGNCSSESSYDIVVSNAKDIPQNVLIVESIPGQWSITSETAPHTKTSSSTADWALNVPPDSKSELQYTARTKWCW
jgi:hypothetical protein